MVAVTSGINPELLSQEKHKRDKQPIRHRNRIVLRVTVMLGVSRRLDENLSQRPSDAMFVEIDT